MSKRNQRIQTDKEAQLLRDSTITEDDLRRFERDGAKVTRHPQYVTVERGAWDKPGGYRCDTYLVLGGGRYRQPSH
ncbi:MAG: hypothetical protein HOW97_18010 [Catenulispora sp.]|nr:hypothetical protein [Catenulispora sp.]